MKVLKYLAVLVGFTIVLGACSENSYRPVSSLPVTGTSTYPYGTQTGYVNGVPVNGYTNGYNNGLPYNNFNYGPQFVNPYLANNAQFYINLNQQAQFRLQAQSLNMFSCAKRRELNFYTYESNTSNCAYRRQPTYTPSTCACISAPCDCDLVLTQVRRRCYPEVPEHVDAPNYINTDPSLPSGIDNNVQTAPISIRGNDAKALFERLAKNEEIINNTSQTHIRNGVNYKCMMDGRAKARYECDIDFSLADGKVYQISPVGQDGNPVINGSAPYEGKNVRIGTAGLNPMEAFIKIDERSAAAMYKKLSVAEVPGTSLDQSRPATIKTGQQVKCYKTSASRVECLVRVSVNNGAAMNVNF